MNQKELANQNQQNKNMRLLLGKELINIRERPSSFCNSDYFILKVRSIVSPL